MIYDSIIIGGGPSGMTAALYLLRAGKKVLLLEKETIGGQIALSPRLENYPSIVSISGEEFSDRLFSQITDLGADFELEEATGVEKELDVFTVQTNYGSHQSKTVILASGCSHRCLGIPGEKEFTGKGVSYCAVCDGPFFAGKEVLLIGDANTALQYAISLSEICKKVTIATLFDRFFADEVLQKKLQTLNNVEIHHSLSSISIEKEGEKLQTLFMNTNAKKAVSFLSDGVFVAVGQKPHNEPFEKVVELKNGFIVTDEEMRTKTPGLFACGDCRTKKLRQVVTATNDGAIAANSANCYLQSL
ncbi:MAG: FAD-dependent oxidoreductase [bacterium]|nr:FAD-dependent oxidoreductase [bacterium]